MPFIPERLKAVFLNELARLHLQFGELESALQYYKMAQEEIHMFPYSFGDLCTQTQILCAYAYTIG